MEPRQFWMLEGFTKLTECFVAEASEKIVGFASLVMDGEKGPMLDVVYVHKEMERKGIGTALTKVALEKCQEAGVKEVWCIAHSRGMHAIIQQLPAELRKIVREIEEYENSLLGDDEMP